MINIPEWVPDAVFYQIYPDRFAYSTALPKPAGLQPWGSTPTHNGFQGGDLLGVVEHLDYLLELGINAIYLNPIFTSTANHRYHTHDYYNVDPILGGNETFRRFIEACHGRGIRVILDGVFNHASRGFFQFNHLLENGEESPYRDWFTPFSWPLNAYDEDKPANFASWWGLHALPKFNTENLEVREFLFDVATHWLKLGIDGWRLDVPSEIDDDEFWREFRSRCRAVNPECYIVGEIWDEAGRWLQGDQFDAQMNYLLTGAALGFFVGDDLNRAMLEETGLKTISTLSGDEFAHELDRINKRIYSPEIVPAQLNLLGSHDTPRIYTVANRDESLVRLLYLCMFTMPGAPTIYYGDEIGMEGEHDPHNRGAFPWDKPEAWNHSLRGYLRSLIAIRGQSELLKRGDFNNIYSSNDLVVYSRSLNGQSALVALNRSTEPQQFSVARDFGGGVPLANLLNGEMPNLIPGIAYTVGPRSGQLWSHQSPTRQT